MTSLPIEIWLRVMNFLEPKSLAKMCRISKYLSSIASSKAAWLPIFHSNSLSLPQDNNYPMAYAKFRNKFKQFHVVHSKVKHWESKLRTINDRAELPLKLNFENTWEINDIIEQQSSLFPQNEWNENIAAFLLLFHFVNGEKPIEPGTLTGFFGGYECYNDIFYNIFAPSKGTIKRQFSQNTFRSLEHNHEIIDAETARKCGNGELEGNVIRIFSGISDSYVSYGPFISFFESRLNLIYNKNLCRILYPSRLPHLILTSVHSRDPNDIYYGRRETNINGIGKFIVEVSTAPSYIIETENIDFLQ